LTQRAQKLVAAQSPATGHSPSSTPYPSLRDTFSRKGRRAVSFPDVPAVIGVADTLDDASRERGAAPGFAFEDWPGEPPAPRTPDELRKDTDFLAWSADAVVAVVPPALPLRTPHSRLRMLACDVPLSGTS